MRLNHRITSYLQTCQHQGTPIIIQSCKNSTSIPIFLDFFRYVLPFTCAKSAKNLLETQKKPPPSLLMFPFRYDSLKSKAPDAGRRDAPRCWLRNGARSVGNGNDGGAPGGAGALGATAGTQQLGRGRLVTGEKMETAF